MNGMTKQERDQSRSTSSSTMPSLLMRSITCVPRQSPSLDYRNPPYRLAVGLLQFGDPSCVRRLTLRLELLYRRQLVLLRRIID